MYRLILFEKTIEEVEEKNSIIIILILILPIIIIIIIVVVVVVVALVSYPANWSSLSVVCQNKTKRNENLRHKNCV